MIGKSLTLDPKAVFLKIECACKTPGNPVKMQTLSQ